MADALDGACDNGETNDDADEVYNQICEEQGIAMSGDATNVGTGQIGQANPEPAKNAEVDDLQKRLDNLNQ